MYRVRIRSRVGNVVLAALGVLYAISGVVLFIAFVAQSWGAASVIDRGLQGLLLFASAAGTWFVLVAWMNLSEKGTPPQHARQHRASAEATT